jgi:hypothetical protein
MKALIMTITLALAFAALADGKKVKKEVGEAVEAAKQEFVSKTNEELAALDKEIEDLKAKARVATAETQKKVNEQIANIERERKLLADKLDEVAKSSGNAWRELKGGAQSAWSQLKNSVKKAGKEFSK